MLKFNTDSFGVVDMRLFYDAIGLYTIRGRGIQIVSFYRWPIMEDNGAPTRHDNPVSLGCPV